MNFCKKDLRFNDVVAVMLNSALLVAYTIITAFAFDPWWVGFTIGFWVAIVQLTLVIFIKYYQSYYQVKYLNLIDIDELYGVIFHNARPYPIYNLDCDNGYLCYGNTQE